MNQLTHPACYRPRRVSPLRLRRLVGLISTAALLITQSCDSPTVDTVGESQAFCPAQVGDFWVYQISRDTYAAVVTSTHESYQLQHRISDTFIQDGQTCFVLEESTRKTDRQDWQLVALTAVCPTPAELISLDSNVPHVSLIFPVSDGLSWNLNRYNANPDTLLQYANSNQLYRLGNRTFYRTITVTGTNDSTLVGQHTYRRVYARGIGLVYRDDAALAFCQSTPTCVGQTIIESGTRQTWTLIGGSRLP